MKALWQSRPGKLPFRVCLLRITSMPLAPATSKQIPTTSGIGDLAEVSLTPNFYELTEQPFAASPDPRFLYMSGTHRLAFASLLRALQANRGMVTLLAPAGLGKTTLLFHTLKSFGDKVVTIYLFQAAQTPIDLLQAILTDLGVSAIAETAEGMLPQLTEVLTEESRLGKRVIVVIDDAQDLHASVFETLAFLSNLESPRGRLIQFILCGQPMLGDKLAAIKSLQSMQRGMPTAHLEPFSAQETAQYVDHRLRSAGYLRRSPLFTPEAAALAARFSQGSPRIINSLCFEALSISCQAKREHIAADTVREAAATLNLTDAKLEPGPRTFPVRPAPALAVPSVSAMTAGLPVPQKPLVPQATVTPLVHPAPQQQILEPETILAVAALPAPGALTTQAPKVEPQAKPAPPALVATEKALAPPQPPAPQTMERPNDLLQPPALPPPVACLAPQRPIVAADIVLPAQPFSRRSNPLGKPTRLLAKPESSPVTVPGRGFPTYPSIAPLLRGLTMAIVLLLAITGAIFGLYKTKSSHGAAKQAAATPPNLRPAAPTVQREQPRAMASVSRAAPVVVRQKHADAALSSVHDLKGMDLQSALRALPLKGQRQQKSRRRQHLLHPKSTRVAI